MISLFGISLFFKVSNYFGIFYFDYSACQTLEIPLVSMWDSAFGCHLGFHQDMWAPILEKRTVLEEKVIQVVIWLCVIIRIVIL